jgi:hypothetical protein
MREGDVGVSVACKCLFGGGRLADVGFAGRLAPFVLRRRLRGKQWRGDLFVFLFFSFGRDLF